MWFCGAQNHLASSCPLNKRRQYLGNCADDNKDDNSNDEQDDSTSEDGAVCTCGTSKASHRRDCPLNPRIQTIDVYKQWLLYDYDL